MTFVDRRHRSRVLLLVLSVVGATLAPLTAEAQSAPSDKAGAEALFDEARSLMKGGKYEPACAKLAESQRLDPGIGTLLYLASCQEKLGKLATAWATFREAAGAAQLAGQSAREKAAMARANALAPSVPHLTIEPDSSAGDPEIARDGVPVGKALWGTALPVDPGSHVIDVRRTGHKPRSITIQIAPGEALRLPIEPLEREEASSPSAIVSESGGPTTPVTLATPVSPAPATNEPRTSDDGSPGTFRRVLPYASAGVGVAGVVVGTIFGLRAFSLASDVEQVCPAGPCSSDVAATANDSATAGNVATVAFAVGAVGLTAAVVLWLTAPSSSSSQVGAGKVWRANVAPGGVAFTF